MLFSCSVMRSWSLSSNRDSCLKGSYRRDKHTKKNSGNNVLGKRSKNKQTNKQSPRGSKNKQTNKQKNPTASIVKG